jgi:hypothetical protein
VTVSFRNGGRGLVFGGNNYGNIFRFETKENLLESYRLNIV